MILKASQRGGGKQLALHLLKTENEHVEVHEVRGFVSDDLVGAMKEAYAVSKGTRCRQFLFSVSLNPPETEHVPIETFETAINRIEEATGLTGQPRVIVFHEKEGRRHCHAVWSRIDAESMTAVNLPFFKLKLREVSRELYLENDWKMPRGLMNSAERDPRNFTLEEWQQARRAGWHAGDLKAAVQDCWAISDTRGAFEQALKERGMTLAKGDRRSHVAVTHDGEVISIARYAGKKAKQVRAKLGEADALPTVDQAKAQFAQDMTGTLGRLLQEARERKQQGVAPLEAQRRVMAQKHREERERLKTAQDARWTNESRERAARFRQGLLGRLWSRLSGERARIERENQAEAYAALQRDRVQRQAIVEAQLKDRQKLQSQLREMRRRHADLFRQIRQERDRYRQAARAAAVTVKPQFEEVKAARSIPVQAPAPRPARPTIAFRNAAEQLEKLRSGSAQSRETGHSSGPDDLKARLEKIRSGASNEKGRPGKGPSIER
jgi:hypothetical protein